MIKLYVTPSCTSCHKARKWFEKHRVAIEIINILKHQFQVEELIEILKFTENGFEDIIAKKSEYYQKNSLDFENLSFSDLSKIIIENPRILKRPLILSVNSLQIGFNEEDIREFIPKDLRKKIICEDCDVFNDTCDYQNILNSYFEEIKGELKKERL